MTNKDESPKLLDHNYDGIQELDNPLPRWWVWLFYLTIIFGFCYVGYYWFGPGLSIQESFALSMKTEAHASEVTSESALRFENTAETVALGKDIFQSKCAACHGQEAQGVIGPNLTDDYWIHGGTNDEIYHVISEGVTEKGMLSWKALIKPVDIEHLVVYIQSLKGSNPQNAKPPQGDLVE